VRLRAWNPLKRSAGSSFGCSRRCATATRRASTRGCPVSRASSGSGRTSSSGGRTARTPGGSGGSRSASSEGIRGGSSGTFTPLCEDSVGWAAARAEFDASEGVVPVRFTCVLHLEHGEWKIVQWHSSVPSSNEEHGFFLTKSVDEIVEAVSESRPDLSSTSAPDGTVTIAFTDIEDSLKLNAFLGDQRWLEVLRVHNEVVTQVTDDHGGTVVKGQGDGFMLAFASARRALSCAQAIERAIDEAFAGPGSVVRVRIGVHVGETVQEADDFFGQAVSYAARIASAAAGGEIVVSELVHALVAQTGEFTFEEPRHVELKGVDGPQKVYPLLVGTSEPLAAVD
jgi:class 3 adenylate cyclase